MFERVEKVNIEKQNLVKNIRYFLYILSFVIMFVFFFSQLLEKDRFVVSGYSMSPTLIDGQKLLYEKTSILDKDSLPNRYDIIIFEDYNNGIDVKRVYGLPGETIQIKDNSIFINGNKIEDNYNIREDWESGIANKELLLKENEYFVLGDNRNRSSDSRHIDLGPIDERMVIGKAFFLAVPGKTAETGVREWSRVGLIE